MMDLRPVDHYSERVVRGRRDYVCTFCRRGIERGLQHVRISNCVGGDWRTCRAHLDCHATASGRAALPAGEQPARATPPGLPHEHVTAPAACADSARNFSDDHA